MLLRVENLILQFVKNRSSTLKKNKSLLDEIMSLRKRFDSNIQDAVVDSIISRDWRVLNFLMTEKNNVKISTEENFNEESKEDDLPPENIQEDDKFAQMKNAVDQKTSESEKLDEWYK